MWRQTLNQQGRAYGLEPQQIAYLEQRLDKTVFIPTQPERVQQFLSQSPLTQALRQVRDFGVEQACLGLEVTAALTALCLEANQLEKLGLFSPSAYTALEFALAECLPHLEPRLQAATRQRLRLAINPPPGLSA